MMKLHWTMAGIMAAALGWTNPAQTAERILVPQLPGWKTIDSHNDAEVESNSLIPNDETEETWTRRLTIQAFRDTPMTATAFLEGLIDRIDEVCDGIAAEPLLPGPSGPYESARRTIACGRYHGDGKGSFTLYYALRGKEALYVLARSWRGDPFVPGAVRPVTQAELSRWSATFDAVRLCDGADPARPCPALK